MKKTFSVQWKSSTQPRKQRKYRLNSPLHIKQTFMHAHLSKELHHKYGPRAIPLKTGDKVRVMRGSFAKKEGKVERVHLKRERVYVTGMERLKKDGSKLLVAFHPSQLLITEAVMDANRKKKFEKKVLPITKK